MIKAIVFDMDGVLIDAKEWHYEALNRSLNLFGFEISRHDHLVTYDGLPTKKKLELLSKESGLPHTLHDFINEMKQVYTMEIVHAKCKPVFYHQFALSQLKLKGYRLAVASNSVRKTVEVMMDMSSLAQYLEFFLSNEDVSDPKPASEIYDCAIKNLGLSPSEVLVVEDNFNGIIAAKASGAHVYEVKGVEDVNYEAIKASINKVSGENS